MSSSNYEHMDVEYEKILEYETDQESPLDAAMAKPVNVCVVEPVLTMPGVSQYVSAYTLVVDTDANETYVELLPYDPLRTRATILVTGTAVVITHSLTDAQDSRNQVANVPNPIGAYLPASTTPVIMTHTGRMWVAATSTEGARVTVITERRDSA